MKKTNEEMEVKKSTQVRVKQATAQTIDAVAVGTQPEVNISNVVSKAISSVAIDQEASPAVLAQTSELIQVLPHPPSTITTPGNIYQIYQTGVGNSSNVINFSSLVEQQNKIFSSEQEASQKLCDYLNKKSLEEIDENQLKYYIPVQGCIHSYENCFDLMGLTNTFLSSPKRVMLIMGEGGYGKTTFCHYLTKILQEKSIENKTIVLYILLVNSKDATNNLIENYLANMGLSPTEINSLKKAYQFVIILDGYDEIDKGRYQNLYALNRLDTWNAKVIITVRTSYIINVQNYKSKFYPFEHANPSINAFQEVMLIPFSQEQIKAYVERYLKSPPTSNRALEDWRDPEKYIEYINLLPGIPELVKSPFLLCVLMEVLPKIATEYDADFKQNFEPFTQMKLLDAFVESYWERHEFKLIWSGQSPNDGSSIAGQCEALCIELAKTMKLEGINRIVYRKGDRWEAYFGSKNKEMINIREGSLLRRVCSAPGEGHLIGFIHDLFIDYFVARSERNEFKRGEALAIDFYLMKGPVSSMLYSEAKSLPRGSSSRLTCYSSTSFFNLPVATSFFTPTEPPVESTNSNRQEENGMKFKAGNNNSTE